MHVGDYGFPLTYRLVNDTTGLPVDLTTMSLCTLYYTRPSGAIVSKAAAVKTPPGTDGRVVYTVESGLLTEAGFWRVRAIAEFTSSRFTSDWETFEVEA